MRLTPFFFLLSHLFLTAAHAAALPLPPAPHIIVIGEATVESMPDIVDISIELGDTAKDYATAKQAVDQQVSQAIQAATANGVTQEDMQASKIQATPQYTWQDKERIYQGERVNRTLSMQLKQPDLYNALVNALLETGITRINNVSFEISNRAEVETAALQQALDNAKETAQQISNRLGARLGEVFQIAPVTPTMYPKMAALTVTQNATPQAELTPSKQAISQQIRVVFLLEKNSPAIDNTLQ